MDTQKGALRAFFPTRATLGYWTLTFLAYVLAAKVGQFVYANLETSSPVSVWAPSGIGMAAIFLGGRSMASAIALAQLVSSVSNGSPTPLIIAATIGFTLQSLAGGFFFKLFDFHPNITRMRDTVLLLLSAVFIPAIAPTFTFAARVISGIGADEAFLFWKIVWAGGILSVLVVTPLITSFVMDMRVYREHMLEHALAIIAVCAGAYALFWAQIPSVGTVPLIYIAMVPFFWIAIRFSPRSTAVALFLMSVISISGIIVHPPPHPTMDLGTLLFQLELWLEVFAAIFLIMSTAVEDRRTAVRDLRAHVEQLETAVSKISEEDSAKSDFLAILSHELRNPLAPVLSTLELLRIKRDPGDDESALIVGAETRLRMMGRLLDDLLDISRISEKRLKLKKEYVNLREIAQRSIDGARPMIDKYRHTLEVSLPTHDITIFADPIRIEQVLVNILNNAAKYTHKGGKIEFSLQERGSRAAFTVRDNGTGIEASMLSRIFEPFIQVSNTKYGTSGVGVGLALAKELVEMHDGTISALSAGLGRGSTFVIEFPTVHAPESALGAEPAAARAMRPLSILVIDDNQAGTEALGRLLTFRGHSALLAFSGMSGIERANAEQPDAILLDIGLPDVGGYEVARRLRAAGSSAFIIALTGYGQDEDRKMALYSGCDIHLTKPVSLQDIEAALRSRFAA